MLGNLSAASRSLGAVRHGRHPSSWTVLLVGWLLLAISGRAQESTSSASPPAGAVREGPLRPTIGGFQELDLDPIDERTDWADWFRRWLRPRPRLFGSSRFTGEATFGGLSEEDRLSDEDFLNPEEKTQFGAQQGGNRGQPDILGRFLDPIDPARLQNVLDRWLGFDVRKVSDLPKPPEVPEPLYYDLMRPLGALKYDNETNYFLGSFTGKNPTLQLLELEAVVADWRAVELQLNFNNGVFVAAVPGYQRTLGVGPRGNWVHAYQIQVPVYVKSNIVGGRAAYFFAWQPSEESPWAAYLIAGAERVAVSTGGGSIGPGAGHRGSRISSDSVPANLGPGGGPEIPVWRPLAAFDLFYTFNERLSVGVENDIFAHPSHGQYVILPQFVWQPLVHISVKGGAGYFQQGSDGQATFMFRVMITQPTPRKNRDDYDPNPGRDQRSGGSLGRFFRRDQ